MKKKDYVLKIITEELGIRKVSSELEPKLLNDVYKERHMQVCQDMIEGHQNESD